jgi:hypothetical protein
VAVPVPEEEPPSSSAVPETFLQATLVGILAVLERVRSAHWKERKRERHQYGASKQHGWGRRYLK